LHKINQSYINSFYYYYYYCYCYYCYFEYNYKLALEIAEMGQCIDEAYEPLNELIEEINMILSQLEGNEG